MILPRRSFLRFAAAGAGAILVNPQMALATVPSDRRFIFIIQRGAADGLNIVVPYGDPDYASLRREIAIDPATAIKLDGHFVLNPAMPEAGRMFSAGQALFVHATASPYRDRSHFDGQNVLETGGSAAYRLKDGWMNRLLGLLPQSEAGALALSSTVPMALRGSHEVSSYAPSSLPSASDDLLMRVAKLYETDPQLHELWSAAMTTRMTAGDLGGTAGKSGAATGSLAAKLLSGESGARIAMIETGGWDTHSGQRGRLAAQLRGLDQIVAGLKTGLGADWANTLLVVATEFGRTVAPNGTGGTDHGTASAAMLLGGAVAGGRVLADWPGLSQSALYDGRDLKPTMDLDVLIGTALAQHYGLDPSRVMPALFPDGRGSLGQKLIVA